LCFRFSSPDLLGLLSADRQQRRTCYGKEIIEEHNIALAIIVGAVSLGICMIIAASIHLKCK
jgi:uncharacterized membrane protein YjfL (UPF0719 family)